jgi:hypothetical protein
MAKATFFSTKDTKEGTKDTKLDIDERVVFGVPVLLAFKIFFSTSLFHQLDFLDENVV